MSRERKQVDAAKLGLAGRRYGTHQCTQEGRLACPVAADEAAHLPFAQIDCGIADNLDPSDRNAEVGDPKHKLRPPAGRYWLR